MAVKRLKQVSGAAAFESYYDALFGNRWARLREALLQETQPVAFSVRGGKPYYLDQASIYAAQALPPIDGGTCLDMCAAPGGKTLVIASRMGQDAQIQANELSRARRLRLLTVLNEYPHRGYRLRRRYSPSLPASLLRPHFVGCPLLFGAPRNHRCKVSCLLDTCAD